MMTQSLDESPDTPVEDWWDTGPKKASSLRERMCLASRERFPVVRMIRFVRAPDGTLVPDLSAKLPGRGVWIHASRPAIEKVLKSKSGFSGAFRQKTEASSDLIAEIDRLLLERCIATLGLAKRANAVVLGYDQVRNELQKRKPGWLLEARDGALDGRRRVVGLAVAMYDRVRVSKGLTSSELGMAFGREHVVHALLKTGRFTDLWTADYRRLYEFRQLPDTVWISGTVE